MRFIPDYNPAGICSPFCSRGWNRSTLWFMPGSVQPKKSKKLPILLHWECCTLNFGDVEFSACFWTSTLIFAGCGMNFCWKRLIILTAESGLFTFHRFQFSPHLPLSCFYSTSTAFWAFFFLNSELVSLENPLAEQGWAAQRGEHKDAAPLRCCLRATQPPRALLAGCRIEIPPTASET